MAYLAPITSRADALALLGTHPLFALQVETRPTSFLDAVTQYHRLAAERDTINPIDEPSEAAYYEVTSHVEDALHALVEAPASSIAELTVKLAAIRREFAQGVMESHLLDTVLADLIVIGSAA